MIMVRALIEIKNDASFVSIAFSILYFLVISGHSLSHSL